ncbi:MAG TPA: DedA family protein, partial [archaeon]|nr:DedA family protein [archaeon]
GILIYLILFLIIFLETGFVITPFLPGDSLIFAAGLLSISGQLNIFYLFFVLVAAAILGDTVNYWIGNKFGERLFKEKSRYLKKEYLDRAHQFYEKYGGKTIFLARFVPIIRTFAPFVAGIGKMSYKKFLSYNVSGGITWVAAFLLAGFYLGNVPIVKENLSLVIIGIIVVSIVIAFVEFARKK